MIISFLGPQGSGKSTQSKILGKKLNLPVFEVGELLRNSTPEIKQTADTGELIEDKTLDNLLRKKLQTDAYKNGLILDGTPRTRKQAELLEDWLNIDKVIYLTLTDKEATKRLIKRGREDDTYELIQRRLALYRLNEKVLIKFYESRNKLFKFNGNLEVNKLSENIYLKTI